MLRALLERMLGHHELLIRLASGGAANVFLVRDTKAPDPGRLLALKILLPSLASNEDFLRMFFAEAKIASRLQHPNIVAIAGFGQVDGIHCLAMEYVFGASLAQILRASARARKPLTVGVLLRITAIVCEALHYAHEMRDTDGERALGIVHRDVTPQNILIGFNGVPKLTDFGIAKATNRGWETQAGIVKGKFSYMAPEQALGKKVDRRSDVFCTGIVLWEALTGRELFRGSTPMEVLAAIREQKIEPPSKVVEGLTPIVDPIVMKALRRSPRARYQTAKEMRDDIEDLIRRAGVTIDHDTISQELAAIYGDEIVRRAFALRNAMAGRFEEEALAQLLGGAVLNPRQLPVIPGGTTDPDPLGLFAGSDHDSGQSVAEAPPERAHDPFLDALPESVLREFQQLEATESREAVLNDLEALEPDATSLEDTVDPALIDDSSVSGWDENTAVSMPDDDLLAMISEDDATIGYLPPEFAKRFGQELERLPPEEDTGPSLGFGEEATVGAPSDDSAAMPRLLTPREARPATDTASRPVPRAPSVMMEEERVRSTREVPRAPSLDLDRDRTPVPSLEQFDWPRREVSDEDRTPPPLAADDTPLRPLTPEPTPGGHERLRESGDEWPRPVVPPTQPPEVTGLSLAPWLLATMCTACFLAGIAVGWVLAAR